MSDASAPAPLRILHVMRSPVGGLFRHVLDLAGEQAQRGHFVGIIADRTSANELSLQRLAAIEPRLRLGLSLIAMRREPGIGDIAALRSVTKIARALDLDVIHGHGAKGGAYARLARGILKARSERLTAFYTPHGGSLHYAPGTMAGRVFSILERLLGLATDGLIFESDFARGAYDRLVGQTSVPRRVIPNGLGPEDFRIVAPDPDAADFLFIGELRALKGVDVLLNALARIGANRPVRAVIVGGGPDGEAFKAEASQLGLDPTVTFAGVMPAPKAFPLGRALVVPSRAESFPYIVLEAAAAQKPLIATRVGGIPEIVAGTSTELVTPDSVDDLVVHLRRVLDDAEGANTRARELREAVQQKFTVAAMTDGVLAFYRAPA